MKLNPKQFSEGIYSGSFIGDGSQLINVPGGGGGTGSIGPSGSIGPPGPSGSAGRGILSASIVSNNLEFVYTDNTTASLGRVVGTNGIDGNGITSITQTNSSSFTISTRDLAPVNINLPIGPSGSQGPSGSTGPSGSAGTPYDILSLVNNYEYIDHLIPTGASSNQTQYFQAVIRSGAGSAGFLNQSGSWLGGNGIIRLSTGTATATDLGIRATSGTSGHLINSNISEYIFCFYTIALQNGSNLGLFRLCVQNDNTATLTPSNRTGIYLDFDWNTDGVKPTFSVFNNTISSSILLNYPLSINTLYAVRFRVSNSLCELYINGSLLHTFTTNLPVFAPIQQSVGLTKTTGTSGLTYLVDVLAAKNLVNLNNYII